MTLLWASTEGELLLEGRFTHMALLEEHNQLVALGNGDVRLVDLSTFETLGVLKRDGHEASCLAVDAKARRVYVGHTNRDEVESFDLNAFCALNRVRLPTSPRALAFSHRARQVWALSYGRLSIINAGERKAKLSRAVKLRGDAVVQTVALSPDEDVLAVGRDGRCDVYRTFNGSFKMGFQVPPGIHTLSFSPNRRLLASGGGTMREDTTWADDDPRHYVYEHADVRVWNPDTGELMYRGVAHDKFVRAIAWHPSLPLLASADAQGIVHVWRLPDDGPDLVHEGQLGDRWYHGGMRALRFTRDGKHLLALRQDGLVEFRFEDAMPMRRTPDSSHHPIARVALPLTWPTHATWHDHHWWIGAAWGWCAVHATTRDVVRNAQANEHTQMLIPEPAHERVLRLRNVNDAEDVLELRRFNDALVHTVARTPKAPYRPEIDARLEANGTIVSYALKGRLHRVTLTPPFDTASAAFDDTIVTQFSYNTPAGVALSTSGFTEDVRVRLWNTTTLTSTIVLDQQHLHDFSGMLTTSALSQSGLIAVGTQKGEVGVFELVSGERKLKGARHGDGRVHDMAFSANGTLLATAGHDRTARLWDLKSREELAVFPHEVPVHLVRFVPGRAELLTVDQSGTACWWDLTDLTALQDITPRATPSTPTSIFVNEGQVALKRPRQEQAAYFASARRAGLEAFAARSWALYEATPFEEAPPQGARHLVEAYRAARTLSPQFRRMIEDCARQLRDTHALDVQHRLRPGDVKDANRTIEKMTRPDFNTNEEDLPLPMDLLGGTFICSCVRDMYEVAERLGTYFDVVSFNDRMLRPTAAGYRDLQLSVSLDGHVAEVKVLHNLMAQMDAYEHKIFEVQRGISARHQGEMPLVEGLVKKSLLMASRRMYSNIWTEILDREGGEHA